MGRRKSGRRMSKLYCRLYWIRKKSPMIDCLHKSLDEVYRILNSKCWPAGKERDAAFDRGKFPGWSKSGKVSGGGYVLCFLVSKMCNDEASGRGYRETVPEKSEILWSGNWGMSEFGGEIWSGYCSDSCNVQKRDCKSKNAAVSYTHLTLPTILRV